MNNHPSPGEYTRRPEQYVNTARQEEKVTTFSHAILISRLFYAVFFIGFVGYYMDKALQLVRQ